MVRSSPLTRRGVLASAREVEDRYQTGSAHVLPSDARGDVRPPAAGSPLVRCRGTFGCTPQAQAQGGPQVASAVSGPSFRAGDAVASSDTARSWFGLPPMLAAGFCGIVLVLVVAFLVTLINLRNVYDTAGAVTHTQAVIGALQRLMATAVDAETGERGYIITGREAYLEPYERARADSGSEPRRKCGALTAPDDPAQQDDVETIATP